ncbi:MAG: DUF6470 family protein [Clostridia bacterium]
MLQINKTDAQMGIRTTNAKLLITQKPAELDIETKPSKLIIHTEHVKVLIDQSECFKERGLKDPFTLIVEAAEEGRRAVLEGIARIADEGSRMAAIENKSDAFAEIALNNSFDKVDFNVTFIPKSRPKFEVVGGTVDIQVDEGHIRINAKTNKTVIDVEPGKVEIYMIQHPDIDIKFVGKNIDEKV